MVKHDLKLYNKCVRYDEKGQMRLTSNCHGLAIIQFRTTNLLLCMCVTFAVKSFESFEYFDSSFDTVVVSRDPGWLNWKLIYCGCSRDRARWLKTRLVDSQRQLIWRNSRWRPPPPSSQRKRYSSSDWSSTQALALFFSSSSSSCLFREPLLTRAHKD